MGTMGRPYNRDLVHKDAAEQLMAALEDGESVEGIVFGRWSESKREEPEPPIPGNKRGVVLTFEEAEPLMRSWRFDNGSSYATFVWTNRRIFWVSHYDGDGALEHAPRNPASALPHLSGGGWGGARSPVDDDEDKL